MINMSEKTLLWIILVVVFITLILNVFSSKDTETKQMSFGLPKFKKGDDIKANEKE